MKFTLNNDDESDDVNSNIILNDSVNDDLSLNDQPYQQQIFTVVPIEKDAPSYEKYD